MDLAKSIGVDCLNLENFNRTNFNAGRRKVISGMQLLKIYYVILGEKKPDFEEDLETKTLWERDDHFCRSYFLNCLTDDLTNVYSNKPFVKNIRNALEDQYKNEKLSRSCLIDKFLYFRFDDDTKVLPQVKELENRNKAEGENHTLQHLHLRCHCQQTSSLIDVIPH